MGTAETVVSAVARNQDADSRERYRALVETALDIISILNADATIRYVSPAVRRVLGYDPEELIGKNGFTLLHPDDVARMQAVWARWVGTPLASVREQYRDRHKNGSWIDMETAATNLLQDPSVGGIVLNSRDISDRKRAEALLRQNEEKYRSLLSNLPGVTWTSAIDGTTTYISDNVNDVIGYSAAEMCSSADELWLRRIHPDDSQKVITALHALFAQDERFDVEYRFRRKDGQWIWVHDRAFQTYQKDGIR
jgi:PAS domain S-box-containing protein